MGSEGHLLEVIAARREFDDILTIKELTHHFKVKYEAEYDQKITPKWIGNLVRRKLHLRTERRKEGYVISPGESEKINHLLERYGLKPEEAPPAPDTENTDTENDEHGVRDEHTAEDTMTASPMDSSM